MSDDGDDVDADPEYDVDFREHPEAYGIGRGEQGAFRIPPYKHELLPLWGSRTSTTPRRAPRPSTSSTASTATAGSPRG